MRLTIGLCAAGLLASAGCTPDEVQAPSVQAPQSEIEASVAPTSGLIGEWKLDQTGGTIAGRSYRSGIRPTWLREGSGYFPMG